MKLYLWVVADNPKKGDRKGNKKSPFTGAFNLKLYRVRDSNPYHHRERVVS
jgi:hypothetical protein